LNVKSFYFPAFPILQPKKKGRSPWVMGRSKTIMQIYSRHSTILVLLALAQNVTELLQRAADELSLLPKVGGEEAVGVDDGKEGSLEGVLEGLGGTGRAGVSVLDTGELEQTLDGGGGNETGTTGSGDKL
jgi:hypothetical protein